MITFIDYGLMFCSMNFEFYCLLYSIGYLAQGYTVPSIQFQYCLQRSCLLRGACADKQINCEPLL